MKHLVLFDIDGTLLRTNRAGREAMLDAGRELHGPTFHADGVEFSGRLDPLILADLLLANGLEPRPDLVEGLFDAYASRLPDALRDRATPCPGALGLVEALHARDDVVVGLLTGNYGRTGVVKLEATGFDPDHFVIRVWGNESPHTPPSRDHLPGVALDRYMRAQGVAPRASTIIGDTPHDITCARAHDMRALAVTTGIFGRDELGHADRVVDALDPVPEIVEWLLR